jgi:PAS domain S-box-containing protein
MSAVKVPTEEMAKHVVSQWFQELQDRGIRPLPSMSLREVTENAIASLLDSLTRPDWKDAARPNLRVLRFLADQLNLPLEQSLEIFLRLRRHIVRALSLLLENPSEAYERIETVWDEGILKLAAYRQTATQTALELAHRKYQALIEQASDAFLLIRMDEIGTIVEANPAATNLTGYSPEELLGMSALKLAPKEELEKFRDALQELRQKGHVRRPSIGVRRKDGMMVIVDLSATLLVLDSDTYALCIARDVTEQRKMQQRLESVVTHRTKELAQALERERHRAAQMAVLAQIAAEALEAVNEDSVYQSAANALKEHLGLYNVALFAYDKEPTRVDFESMSGSIRRGLVTRLPPVRRCGFDRTFCQDRRTCFGQRCHTPP